MPKNKTVDTVLAEAEQIARVWAANPTFSLGELTLAQLQEMIADLRAKREQTQQLRNQLTALINDTNTRRDAVSNIVTRARSGFRAVYGPNSTQYEQSGGTRSSERKRPTRKRKPDGSGDSGSK
jgi:hypothetical protein